MNKQVKKSLLSIMMVVLFVTLSTIFIYLPKQENILSSLAFVNATKSFYMEDVTKGILLRNAYPTEDSEGLKNDPYVFKVVNNSDKEITYNIIFENNKEKVESKGQEVLDNKYLRYSISNLDHPNHDAYTLSDDNIILTATISPNSETFFAFRMWLDYNSDYGAAGKTFIGTIKIEKVK